MRFWDSSALVPLLLAESRSVSITTLLRSDPEVILWWASPVECRSALYRRYREGALPVAFLNQALGRLQDVVEDADCVSPTTRVRERAERVLVAHPLRAADALQLAAALVWSDESPRGDVFVCLDERLREAARLEGFAIEPR